MAFGHAGAYWHLVEQRLLDAGHSVVNPTFLVRTLTPV